MRNETILANDLIPVFRVNKILALSEIKRYLGTQSPTTIFRKLKSLNYISSYSHRGKYYTLNSIVRFDSKGLWAYKGVRFSQFGTLLNTAKTLIDRSDMGYSANELEAELVVSMQEVVLKLFQSQIVCREKMEGVYIYLSAHAKIKKAQLLLRRKIQSIPCKALSIESLDHELEAAIFLFYSLLDEKQRRLYAGLESFKLGHGGDSKIADLLGIDVHTIAKGRRELFSQDQDSSIEGVRKKGSGRKSVKKKSQK